MFRPPKGLSTPSEIHTTYLPTILKASQFVLLREYKISTDILRSHRLLTSKERKKNPNTK